MYKIRDAKNLNEADMLWLLEHDDSNVDNVQTNLADSDDNEDYLSEHDEIPDEIFQEENDTISQNSNEGINVLEMQLCDSPVYVSKNGMKWSKIPPWDFRTNALRFKAYSFPFNPPSFVLITVYRCDFDFDTAREIEL
ncbi:hypothetical protein FQA39_LY06071 [Lamprigera yunnana]|nr:hypothetical protein FQA39_LY06071 [Lamprigera yunnana]